MTKLQELNSMTDVTPIKYPSNVCKDCGVEANRLTCLKKYGYPPRKKMYDAPTFWVGKCDVCGETKAITGSRDYFSPDFSLLRKLDKVTRDNMHIYEIRREMANKWIHRVHSIRASLPMTQGKVGREMIKEFIEELQQKYNLV